MLLRSAADSNRRKWLRYWREQEVCSDARGGTRFRARGVMAAPRRKRKFHGLVRTVATVLSFRVSSTRANHRVEVVTTPSGIAGPIEVKGEDASRRQRVALVSRGRRHLSVEETETMRLGGRLGASADHQFVQDGRDVMVDGLLGHDQSLGDLRVAESIGH